MKIGDPEFKKGLRGMLQVLPGADREQAARDLAQVSIDLAGEYAREGLLESAGKASSSFPPEDALMSFRFPDGTGVAVTGIIHDSTRPKVGPVTLRVRLYFPCGCVIGRSYGGEVGDQDILVRGEGC